MKNKRIVKISTCIAVVLLLCGTWVAIGFTQTKNIGLTFSGKANHNSYLLGEPVTVEFEFTNTGDAPQTVASGGVDVGSLKIFIANREDGEYKEYFGRGWGRKRGQHVTLQPGQSLKYPEATILWNGVPNVSHLNENAAKQVLAGKITTQYALPEPGVYYIKGVSYVGGEGKTIESEPIKINVEQPDADDVAVWNEIKGNKEFAFLMQDASFDTGKDEEKQQLTDQVEQIIAKYPQSIYSGYLKTNLEKFKEHEAKRNEFYKNMKVGQKPQ